MTILFDASKYIKGAEEVGIVRAHAEYQAQQIAALVYNNLATKRDIQDLAVETKINIQEVKKEINDLALTTKKDIKELEYKLTIRLESMMVVCSGVIIAILGYIIKS